MKSLGRVLEDVIIAPVMTEKSNLLREQGVYVFRVSPRAGKLVVKRAVEKQFSVKVASVRVICVKPKVRGVGVSRRRPGKRSSYKKAYVQTLEKAKISELEA